MKKLLSICLVLLFVTPALADTCKYEDADGRIIYTNIPMKGAKKLSCFGFDGVPASGSGARNGKASRASQPTPAGFPRVDSATQRQRDDARRKILDDELATEKNALDQAKKEYAEGESKPEVFRTASGKTGRDVAKLEEKMKKLQENIDLHEKNIQMLQKELAGTR
jgi:chromosome segregation ATPase